MKKLRLLLLVLFIFFSLDSYTQWHRAYAGIDKDNAINKISFYSPNEGYLAFQNFIGFTEDSGKTIIRKYITNSNVNYNGRNVNLTIGFYPSGVKAFNRNLLIVYGDYFTEPSILYSANGGNTWDLVFHEYIRLNATEYNQGITDLQFPGNGLVGYALHHDRIVKTNNGGLTWIPCFSLNEEKLESLNIISTLVGYARSRNRVLKTIDGGVTWNQLTLPVGHKPTEIFFRNENAGYMAAYINGDVSLFATNDGGNTWVLLNDGSIVPFFSHKMYFSSDSIGYAISGYEIWKTFNKGKTWEPLARSNPFVYLNYGFNDLFFFNNDLAWAGGGYEYLEYTRNGGGNTLPRSYFFIDISQLGSQTINLKNYSRQDYSHKWYKNSQLFSTNYDAQYVTDRISIDTIRLIVSNGVLSDTSEQLIDTRAVRHACFSNYSFIQDTSTVKFFAGDTYSGVKHYWDFGDGIKDSVLTSPVHNYDSAKTYMVKHVVYNPVDRCSDSTIKEVVIARVTNCIGADFSYVNDPFFINRYTFSKTTEAVPINWQSWTWGDGSNPVGGNNPVHTFDSAKTYNVCYIVKPTIGSCTTTVCKNIVVNLFNGCDSRITMTNLGEPTAFRFSSLPFANPSKKRHTWILDNSATLVTNSQDLIEKQYSAKGTEYEWLGQPYPTFRYSVSPDSQFRKVRHIVYDSVTGCESFYDTTFKLSSRIPKLSITYVRHPTVPNYVTFFAQDSINGLPRPFAPRMWKIERWIGGWGGMTYGPNSNLLSPAVSYNFPVQGIYRVALMPDLPNDNQGRQDIYETFINIDSINPCPEIPDFIVGAGSSDKLDISFRANLQLFGGYGTGNGQWFFGDGDSTSIFWGFDYTTHMYDTPGIYQVCMRYVTAAGCIKEICKSVVVSNVKDTIVSPGEILGLNGIADGSSYQWQVDTGSGYMNISNTQGYAGANERWLWMVPPTSYYGYKYRCLATVNSEIVIKIEYVLKFQTLWSGGISPDWNNPANWANGKVPDTNTDIVIPAGTTFSPEVSTNITIRSLTIMTGAIVTVKDGFTITILH